MPKIVQFHIAPGGTVTQIADNNSEAFDIESSDAKDYITIDTTDGNENLKLGTGTRPDMIRLYGANGVVDGNTGNYGINTIVTSSATVPNFYPNKNDQDTGLGHAAADQLSLVAGGVEVARLAQFDSGDFQNVLAVGTDIGDIVSAPNGSLHVRNDSVGVQACFQRDAGKLIIEASGANTTLNSNVDFRVQAGSAVRQCIDSSTGNVGFSTCSATAEVETVGHIDTALSGTFTATNGDTAISSGISTQFTTQLHVGSAIKIGSEGTYTVAAIASDAALTLDSNFTGSTGSGKSGTTDGGELFAVKTGDSKTIFSVNGTGAIGLGTATGSITNSNLVIGDATALDTATYEAKKNTFVGQTEVARAITGGHSNSFFGYQAGEDHVNGDRNTCVGALAGKDITNTGDVTYVGHQAGQLNTGSQNVAIGSSAMTVNGPANSVAIGYQANRQGTGTRNVAVGDNALQQSGSASQCVSIGYQSGLAATGASQTLLGYEAGNSITSGVQNVIIGHSADGTATVDNQIVIGYNAASNGANTVTLGNSSISGLHCEVDSISALSDSRMKDNVRDSALGLDFINALRPVKYEKKHGADWPEEFKETRFFEKTETHTRELEDGTTEEYQVTIPAAEKPADWAPRTEYGLIAQEVKSAMESHNATDWQGHKTLPNGSQALGYSSLVTVLVKAVQELTARIEQLEGGD
tara:strand:- start:3626 stop:5710 length:2085 start_codon:yes stop_codon:yes gene_type:complete